MTKLKELLSKALFDMMYEENKKRGGVFKDD